MKRILPPLVLVLASLACFPTTTRPPFKPRPSAPVFEVELPVPQATRALALALDADSIPVRRTEANDGWLESEWFDVATHQRTSRRILGSDVVKVRAFVDPSRPGHSTLTIEVVYRPRADPSRPDRELEEQLPFTHPVVGRVVLVATALARQYGGKVDSVAATPKKP
jgi:hypothetical protein